MSHRLWWLRFSLCFISSSGEIGVRVPLPFRSFPLYYSLIVVPFDSVWTEVLIPWKWVLLQKLIFAEALKKFSGIYGTRKLITVFTLAYHWPLSSARWVQSTISHLISLKYVFIVPSNLLLDLPCILFPSGDPTNSIVLKKASLNEGQIIKHI